MSTNLADIREFLVNYFSDEELKDLCFDHFREVYNNFTNDHTKSSKARLLVEYCHHRARIGDLLSVLSKQRPDHFQMVFGQSGGGLPGVLTDLNTATSAELQRLPGIGPRLAQAIIYGRPYQTIEDVGRVNGIGPGRLAFLRNWCKV